MKFASGPGKGLWRTRWAAIGAAVAVAVGAGGLLAASAAESVPSSFIAVTPVRLVDSRVALGLTGRRGQVRNLRRRRKFRDLPSSRACACE